MPTPRAPTFAALRTIWIAILAGPLLFAVLIPMLLDESELGGEGAEFLPLAAAILSVVSVPGAFVLRRVGFRRVAALEGDERMAAYANTVIVFAAILEGAILFDLVTWLVTREAIPVVPLLVVLYGIAILSFPSREQLESIRAPE